MMKKHRSLTIGMVMLGAALPGEASAHAHLQSANPAPNAMVSTPPREVRISFSETIEPSLSAIQIVGAQGPVAAASKAFVDQGAPATLIVKLSQPLLPGAYEARWRCVGMDSHVMRGSYHFEVRP